LSPGRRHSARNAQFPPQNWNRWLDDGDNRKRVAAFLQSHGAESQSLTQQNLVSTLENYDQTVQKQVFLGADIRETDADMPLLFWIADSERAVLVIQTYGGEQESAFETTDLRLITALQSIAARYRQFPPPTNTPPPVVRRH